MKTATIDYQHQDQALEGFIAYDETSSGKRPAILFAHDWTGRNEFAMNKAKRVAEMGYVGFALDMYGTGILGTTVEEKSNLIKPFLEDRSLLQARMQTALEVLQAQPNVAADKIIAAGFCFGGLCVLDLARSGAAIAGTVSFHGLLNPAENIKRGSQIKSKVLALHGYDDPMCKPDQVTAFADEMTAAGCDWQIHMYGNTMHAFTNPAANDKDFGTVYDSKADKRSWQAFANFVTEVVG